MLVAMNTSARHGRSDSSRRGCRARRSRFELRVAGVALIANALIVGARNLEDVEPKLPALKSGPSTSCFCREKPKVPSINSVGLSVQVWPSSTA
jgi:hypothetical protein